MMVFSDDIFMARPMGGGTLDLYSILFCFKLDKKESSFDLIWKFRSNTKYQHQNTWKKHYTIKALGLAILFLLCFYLSLVWVQLFGDFYIEVSLISISNGYFFFLGKINYLWFFGLHILIASLMSNIYELFFFFFFILMCHVDINNCKNKYNIV